MPILDKIGVINRAHARLGDVELQSLDDGTPAASAASLIYDDLLKALLSFYPWSFSCKSFPLQQIDEPIYNGFTYVYALRPEAVSHPHRVSILRDGHLTPITDYALEGGRLYANDLNLVCLISVLSDPDTWSPDFLMGFISAYAAAVCIKITHDSEMKATFEAEAWGTPSQNKRGGWIGAAIAADSRNKPSRIIPFGNNPITQARWGG